MMSDDILAVLAAGFRRLADELEELAAARPRRPEECECVADSEEEFRRAFGIVREES